MKSYLTSYAKFIENLDSKRPAFIIVALARTLLAMGSIITLLFSGPDILFDEGIHSQHNINSFFDYINIFNYFGFQYIMYYYALCVVILSFVIMGYYPRFTGIMHWLVSFSILRSATILEGGDQITAILTFLLIPLTLCDTRKNHWIINSTFKDEHYFLANVSWLLIRLQIAVLYFQSSVEKIYKLDEWKDGTAIYYFFNDPVFGYSDWIKIWLHGLLLNGYFVSALSWGTIAFELLLFGAYFMHKKRREKLLISALIFHLGIALIMGLISFYFAMAGGLVLYLASKKTEDSLYSSIHSIKSWNLFRNLHLSTRA